MTWFDIALLLLVAALTVIGAQRKLAGLLIGAGALVLGRFLLLLFARNSLLGIVFALAAGLLLGFAGRSLIQRRRGTSLPASIAGGVGGLLLGLFLIGSTVTSLPIERNLNDQIVYPPRILPFSMRGAVTNSRLVALGRDILLYPLLVRDEVVKPNAVLSGLHSFLVIGEPWERRL